MKVFLMVEMMVDMTALLKAYYLGLKMVLLMALSLAQPTARPTVVWLEPLEKRKVAPRVGWMALQMVFVKVEMTVDWLVVPMESPMGMKMASSSVGQMVVQWVVQ